MFGKETIGKFLQFTGRPGKAVTVTHTRPDGDAVGSSLAFCRYLKDSGWQATALFPDPVPGNLDFIFTEEEKANAVVVFSQDGDAAMEAVSNADLVVCLDFPTPDRALQLGQAIQDSGKTAILIDHHPGPDPDFPALCISRPELSSACEVLYWLLKEAGDGINSGCATALMLGMTTDTNNFANSVRPSTLEMASDLLGKGADREALLEKLYMQQPERRLRAMGHMLDKLLTISDKGVAVSIFRKSDLESFGLEDGDTEGFVNIPLQASGVKISILLKEDTPGHFRVSLRSKKGWSARSLASKYFHGGGHEQASGGKLVVPDDITAPEDAFDYITRATDEEFS